MNNSTLDTEAPRATYHNELVMRYFPASLTFAFTALIGVIGNLIVVKFYGRKTQPKTSFTYLVRWLAWADFLVCVLLFGGAVEIGMNINFDNKYLCKISYFLQQWAITVSTCLLGIISMDRYRKICQPFKSQMSVRFARIAARITIVFTFILAARNVITYDIIIADVTLETDNRTVVVNGYYCGSTTDPDLRIYVDVFNMIDIGAGCFLLLVYVLAYGSITRKLIIHKKSLQGWKSPKPKSPKSETSGVTSEVIQTSDKDISHVNTTEESTSANVHRYLLDITDESVAEKANTAIKANTDCSHQTVLDDNQKFTDETSMTETSENKATTSEACDVTKDGPKSASTKPKTINSESNHGIRIKRPEYQITIMMLWVTVVFLLSLTSFFIGNMLLRQEPHSELAVSPLTLFMIKNVFVNSVSNPFIYYICNASLKAFVNKALKCRCRIPWERIGLICVRDVR